MDDLIIRALQGRATREELQTLRQWCALSDENEERYRELERLWTVTAVAEPGARETAPPDAEDLIARAEAGDGDAMARKEETSLLREERRRAGSGGRPARRWYNGPAVRVGLMAAGLAAVGFALGVLADGTSLIPEPLAASTITTGPGEVATVSLADGSSVRLGPRSRLRFTDEGRRRVVWLEGRAFFGVDESPSRRFVVRTGQGDVAVFGTRFEVRSEDEEFRVLVVEGKVSVTAEDRELELERGEMSRVSLGQPMVKSRVRDVHAHLGWMGNHLAFQATPLRYAVREVRRHFGIRVRLAAPDLEEVPVTATFTGSSPEDVILVLCEIVGARCDIDPQVQRFQIGATDTTA